MEIFTIIEITVLSEVHIEVMFRGMPSPPVYGIVQEDVLEKCVQSQWSLARILNVKNVDVAEIRASLVNREKN